MFDAATESDPQGEHQLEIRVHWEATVLATHFIGRRGDAVLGEHPRSIARVPGALIGADAFVVAEALGDGYRIAVPPGATATLSRGAEAPSCAAKTTIVTAPGDVVKIALGAFELEIVHGWRAAPVPRRGLGERLRSGAARHVLGAACVHAAFFGVFAYYTPALAGTDERSERDDKLALMRQYLVAAAVREHDVSPEKTEDGPEGGTASHAAARAAELAGAMGAATATTNGRWGHLGAARERSLPFDRTAELADARTFGLIGVLATGQEASAAVAWRALDPVGSDSRSAAGAMWGANIDEAAGTGGLALSDTGPGGGGDRTGVGLAAGDPFGGHGLFGHALGKDGIGRGGTCKGCSLGPHQVATVTWPRTGDVSINGHVPAELIQRIVRNNMGRFRSCYEAGLRANPALAGRVVTRFAIDRHGLVSSAMNGGSTLADPQVVACVVQAFYSLSFPEHEGGIVTVVYPLSLEPF